MTKAIYFAGDKYIELSATPQPICKIKVIKDSYIESGTGQVGGGHMGNLASAGEVYDCYGFITAFYNPGSYKNWASVSNPDGDYKYGFIEISDIEIIN